MHVRGEIHIVLRSLQRGGIERCRLRMARRCRQYGIPVKFLLVEDRGAFRAELPPDIPIVHIGRWGKWMFPFALLRHLYREQPAAIWSAADDIHVVTLLAARLGSRRTRVVISKHSTFSVEYGDARGVRALRREFLRWAWRRILVFADGMVCVSRGVAKDLSAATGIPEGMLSVVYNPVIEANEGLESTESRDARGTSGRTLAFVGRLVACKDVPLLVRAVAILRQRVPGVRLIIAGDGPERARVTAAVEREGLEDCVEMLGEVPDPERIMQMSEVVVLSSNREGLGCVLIEAMGCGVQVVATDCPHGPSEILENGAFGQLVRVGDAAGLARAVERVFSGEACVPSEKLRKRAGEFSVDAATKRYLELSGWPVSGLPEASEGAPQRSEC